jgi:c-di-GMP-binding flagellar brake protein YcgR
MDLHPQGTISLQFSEDTTPRECRLVGSEAPDFFIVRLPMDIDGSAVRAGQNVVAVYSGNGLAHKFDVAVLHCLPKFQLLLLSYPEIDDVRNLRRETRVNCRIPATASIEERALKGLITDISNHGCQFIVKIPTRFKLYRVSVLTDINLSLSLFGPREAAQLKGKVRNTNIDEFKIVLGIEFDHLEEALSRRLRSFIDELDVLH